MLSVAISSLLSAPRALSGLRQHSEGEIAPDHRISLGSGHRTLELDIRADGRLETIILKWPSLVSVLRWGFAMLNYRIYPASMLETVMK